MKFSIQLSRLVSVFQEIAQGYAWICIVPRWQAGFFLGMVTFTNPWIGCLGVVGAFSGWVAGKLAGGDSSTRPLSAYNGVLIGLLIAHTWAISPSLVLFVIFAAMAAGWAAVAIGRMCWSTLDLPCFSVPFSLVAMILVALTNSLGAFQLSAYEEPTTFLGGPAERFLAAVGSLYFEPNASAGLVVCAVIFAYSRYYLLLAIASYFAASALFSSFGVAPEHMIFSGWDSCAIIASLLVGGLLATPSFVTASLGILAAIYSSWIAIGFARVLADFHLAPFSLPFVIGSWLVLYPCVRNMKIMGRFNLHTPDLPERTHERERISRSRIGNPGSVPIALPFLGDWTVSQGFSGSHTHQGPWKHALDFIIMKSDKSFSGRGNRLEDFYCFDQPVLSPVYGQVWRAVSHIADNSPGTVNVAAHWGNYVVIRLYTGKFALVAHLKQGSVIVAPGAWLKPGDVVGRCGNSGRSPQPHIHLHVQVGDEPGAATVPFHLASVLISEEGEAARYKLAVVPRESSRLSSAKEGNALPFYLLAGLGLRYTAVRNESVTPNWTLRCEVDRQGRMTLVSSAGAHSIAESTWAVFSCYECGGKSDPFFDLWVLACGYTPTSFDVDNWTEQFTPAKLFPLRAAKWLSSMVWPWTAFAESSYTRQWDDVAQAWSQNGVHRQKISGIVVKTQAMIVPQIGCTYISAEVGGVHYKLQATSSFQRADLGVPAWEAALNIATSLRKSE